MMFTERHWLPLVGLIASLLAGCATGSGRLTTDEAALRGLRDSRGEPLDLSRVVSEHDATVLVWWATRCPCVERYHERVLALRRDYPSERVAVLAVASNADDDRARVERVARERGVSLPVIHDVAARLARQYQVRSTPTVIVLDRSAEVRFSGWIDNERAPGEAGRVAYLDDALRALLAGSDVRTGRTRTFGCPITR